MGIVNLAESIRILRLMYSSILPLSPPSKLKKGFISPKNPKGKENASAANREAPPLPLLCTSAQLRV